MSATVTVALVGEPACRDDALTDEELNLPYSERPTVTLKAREDQKMGELLGEAAARLGVEGRGTERYLPFQMGFYRPEDETEAPPVYSSLLPLLQSDGQLTWTWNIPEVTYGQVLQAAEAGAIYGDPARMHIALEPPVGNGVPLDWETVSHIYWIIKEVFDVIAVPGAVAGTWAVMRRRQAKNAAAAADTLEREGKGWQERGGDPHAFDVWLDFRPWDPRELARLLSCSAEAAEAVLWAFGFGESSDGRWRRSGTVEAEFIDNLRDKVILSRAYSRPTDDQLRDELRRRATVLAQTGRAPPPPEWADLEWV